MAFRLGASERCCSDGPPPSVLGGSSSIPREGEDQCNDTRCFIGKAYFESINLVKLNRDLNQKTQRKLFGRKWDLLFQGKVGEIL